MKNHHMSSIVLYSFISYLCAQNCDKITVVDKYYKGVFLYKNMNK